MARDWDKSQKDIAEEAALQAKQNTNIMNWRMAHERAYLPELLGGARQMMVDEYNRPQTIGTSDYFQPTGLVNRQRYSPEDYRLDVTVPEVKREDDIVIDDTNVRPPPGFGHPLDGDSNPIDYIPPFPYPELIAQVIPKVVEGGGDIARGLFGWVDDRLGNKPSDLVNTMKDRLGWQSPYDYTKDWEDLVYGDKQDDGSYGKTGTDWSQWASIPNLADALGDTIRNEYDGRVQTNESLWDPFGGATPSETNPLDASTFNPQDLANTDYGRNYDPPTDGTSEDVKRFPWHKEGMTQDQILAAIKRDQNSTLASEFAGIMPMIVQPKYYEDLQTEKNKGEIASGEAIPIDQNKRIILQMIYGDGLAIETIEGGNEGNGYLRDPKGIYRELFSTMPTDPSQMEAWIKEQQVRVHGTKGLALEPGDRGWEERGRSDQRRGKTTIPSEESSPLSLEESMMSTMGAGPTDQIDAIIEAYKRQAGRYPSEEEVIAIIEKQSGGGSQERII